MLYTIYIGEYPLVMNKREMLNYVEENYNHYIDRESNIEEINGVLAPWNVKVKEANPDQVLSYKPSTIVTVDELREIVSISAEGTNKELIEYIDNLISKIDPVKTLVTHIGKEDNEENNHIVYIRARADVGLKVLNIQVYYFKITERERDWIFVESILPDMVQVIPENKVSVLNLKTDFVTEGSIPQWDLYLANPKEEKVKQQVNFIERVMKKKYFKNK
jgi:hypothetical protein